MDTVSMSRQSVHAADRLSLFCSSSLSGKSQRARKTAWALRSLSRLPNHLPSPLTIVGKGKEVGYQAEYKRIVAPFLHAGECGANTKSISPHRSLTVLVIGKRDQPERALRMSMILLSPSGTQISLLSACRLTCLMFTRSSAPSQNDPFTRRAKHLGPALQKCLPSWKCPLISEVLRFDVLIAGDDTKTL